MSNIKYSDSTTRPMRLGEWLRELREQRGLPLREVAERTDMDLTHLQKIELGQRLPTEEQTKRLAKFFQLNEMETQARRIAEKFQHDYSESPAVRKAIGILAEEAGLYATNVKNGKGIR